LATLRQGDDYASLLAALQANGGDPTHIEKLRAGLAAPDFKKLGSEFAALAPTIAAALAPAPEQKPVEASPPAGFVQSTLAYLQARAKQVVRVRPVGGVDETTARLERIGKDIDRRDLAAALSEIAILPEKARALASDWVKAAQTRLDAEDAAKAELADSVQGLSKSRS
jgi:hypothetical protein